MIGELAALSASLCWAVGSHLIGRIGRLGGVSAGSMNLGKCLVATLMFALTELLFAGKLVPDVAPRAAAWLAVSGFVGLSLGDSAYFQAILELGVRRALLILSTAPIFVAIGGALWLDEPLGLRDSVAILIVLGGVVFVVREQDDAPPQPTAVEATPRRALLGILCGIGAALGQAAGNLTARAGMSKGVGSLDASFIRLSAGVLGLGIVLTLSRRLPLFLRPLARPRVIGAIAVASTVGTFCGIWFSQLALGHARSTAIASTLLSTSPIFALPLGRWLNAERITLRALSGTIVASAGLMLLTWSEP